VSYAPDAGTAELGDDPEWLDRAPEAGETAVVNNKPQVLLHVVEEHPLPAGEIAKRGETVADQLEVADDRAVVSCVQHTDLAACPREFETHDDVVDAVDDGAVIPDPYPTSLIAPLPFEIREEMYRMVKG
jgi:hypothetical protein